MNNQEKTRELALRTIVEKELRGKAHGIEELVGGYYGHVYKVTGENSVGPQEVVIKLVSNEKESPYTEEPNDNRVYGSRWSNLKPSHVLLEKNNLAVPKLYAIGTLEDFHQQYSIMEFIAGKATKDLLLLPNTPSVPELHALVGDTLGKMHAIRRGFQGWVDMPEPYSKDWGSAFFESVSSHLERAAQLSQFVLDNKERIQTFIAQKKESWTDPKTFVLSHTDGFQGMADFKNNAWKLTGIIDAEDNQFTDQRFVLAGHELSLQYSEREVLPEFWIAYKSHTEVDGSFEDCKSLFKLYYVLCWTSVASEGWRGKPEEQAKAFGRLEELIEEFTKE